MGRLFGFSRASNSLIQKIWVLPEKGGVKKASCNFTKKLLSLRQSVSLFDLEQKIYFAGDTLGVCYRKWDLDGKIFAFLPSAPNQFEPEVWKNTLKEIQKLNLQKICVTHFGEVSSVSELLSQVEVL